MSILEQFGVSSEQAADLKHSTTKYPEVVKGRVAHIDADFMAYQVSAESKAELDPDDPTPRKTYEDMLHNAYEAVDHIRRMAAAERAVLHTTHDKSKGDRESIAIQKEYQANRKDREKPEHLDSIRLFLGSGVGDRAGLFTGIAHHDQEADDGMAQALYADQENAILCSADKDLKMVPGWKLDMSTGKIYRTKDDFGYIYLDDTKSTKKINGYGTKFFWAQLLWGDTADNIQGLPECPGSVWQYHAGTAAYRKLHAEWVAAANPELADAINVKLRKLEAKTKKCGPALTYDLLKDCKSDKDCYDTVRLCYTRLRDEHGYEFKHWRTGEVKSPTQVLLSEMQLLWMRRSKDPLDVLKWLKEKQKQ